MKKLFLLLFVLSLLIVNVKASEEDELAASAETTRRQIMNSENLKPGVFEIPLFMHMNAKVKCVDGDTLYVYGGKVFEYLMPKKLSDNEAVIPARIAGIDAFDSQSKKMIEKQKKATGLSEKEIKKRAKKAKEYCEEYFNKKGNCNIFYVYGVDKYSRLVYAPCNGDYQRNLVDKGLATIYKGNDLYQLIFDEDY